MLYLKITDKNKEIKFTAQGSVIKEIYQGEFSEGDEIYIRLDGTNTFAVQLDESLQESLIYCPNKSFTFTIPNARELKMFKSAEIQISCPLTLDTMLGIENSFVTGTKAIKNRQICLIFN